MTDLAAASVSEHLKVLRETGLLVLETRGRWRVYRSNPSLLDLAATELADLATEHGDTGEKLSYHSAREDHR